MMTRTHFEAIAYTLDANVAPLELVQDFADMLEAQNESFNRELFVRASTRRLLDQTRHKDRKLASIHGVA